MNAIQLLRQQLSDAHNTLEATMSGLSNTALHFNKTKKALPVGAAYAHAVVLEDVVVATMLANTKMLSAKLVTGLSMPIPSMQEWAKHAAWAKKVKIDMKKLQSFSKKVYKATDAYFAKLKESDLDKEVDLSSMGMGKKNLAFVINNFLILHIANLTGEISAAKGIQGLKGYPF